MGALATTASAGQRWRLPAWTMPLLLGLVALGVYMRTLAPTAQWGDSAELATAAYVMGIPHPTGYPLYVLLGKLFTYLPVGDVAYRVNLMSAVFASLAVSLLYVLMVEVGLGRRISAAVALSLAFTRIFWQEAVVTEVYALHAFFIVLLLLLVVRWRKTGSRRYLYLIGLATGFSLAHHGMTLMLLPGILYGVFFLGTGRPRLRDLALMAVLALPGLSLYSYLPLRQAAHAPLDFATIVGVDLTSPKGLLWFVSGSLFRAEMTTASPGLSFEQLRLALGIVAIESLYVGWLVVYAGAVRQYKRDRRLLSFFLLVFGFNLLFISLYHIADISDYFSILALLSVVWAAEGLEWGLQGLRSGARRLSVAARGGAWGWLPWVALPLPVLFLLVNFRAADYSSYSEPVTLSHRILEPLPRDAVVFVYYPWAPLWYVQMVEGVRPDVAVVDLGLNSLKTRAFSIPRKADRAAQIQVARSKLLELVGGYEGRPRFILNYDQTVAEQYNLLKDPALKLPYALEAKGPPYVRGEDASTRDFQGPRFSDSLELIVWDVEPGQVTAGDFVRIKLAWRVVGQPVAVETLAFLLENASEAERATSGKKLEYAMRQGHGVLSPDRWQKGTVVEEYYDIFIPFDFEQGDYSLKLSITYQGKRFPVRVPEQPSEVYNAVTLGNIEVKTAGQ